jgi:CHRD domain
MTNTKTVLLSAGIIVGAITMVSAAQAEMLKFHADMSVTEETPPAEGTGKGSAEVMVDTDAKKVAWNVKVDGLTGGATAAHIHGPAAVGEKAPPEVDMSKSVMEGTSDITEAQIADIQAGKTYVNIHTAKYPDGEIRGQLMAVK